MRALWCVGDGGSVAACSRDVVAQIAISRSLEVAGGMLLTLDVLTAQVPSHGAAGGGMGGGGIGGVQVGGRQ